MSVIYEKQEHIAIVTIDRPERICIVAEHATFSVAEPKRGLFIGGGTMVRLPRQVSFVWAMEILFACDFISAQQALDIGVINRGGA